MRLDLKYLTISGALFASLLLFEGYSDRAKPPLPGDVPTVGFGTTGGVKPGDTTTVERALARALKDVTVFEGALKSCVKVPLAQHEYDAFVSFSYNVGSGAFCSSTLVRKLNQKDYTGACRELLRWTKFQGKDCRDPANRCGGIVKRRESEFKLCSTGER